MTIKYLLQVGPLFSVTTDNKWQKFGQNLPDNSKLMDKHTDMFRVQTLDFLNISIIICSINILFHHKYYYNTMYIFLQTKESTALEKSEIKQPSYKSVDFNGIQNQSFILEDEHQTGRIKTDIKV